MTYRIETRDEGGSWDQYGDHWDLSNEGYEANTFATYDEAYLAWDDLCEALPAYRDTEFRIVEVAQ